MELKPEPVKGNGDRIAMLKDLSLAAILFHFIVKITGMRTDKVYQRISNKLQNNPTACPIFGSLDAY